MSASIQGGQAAAAPARPLIVTADADLLDDMLRLAAAAGVEVDVAAHAQAASRSWLRAPMVALGRDLVEQACASGLPRRDRVVVVAKSEADDALWRLALDVGAEQIVVLPEAEMWLTGRFADALAGDAPVGNLLAVMGARGGAGASTVAYAVAQRAARRGVRSLLMDCDPAGAGIDLALAIDDVVGVRWPELSRLVGRLSPAALADALPRCESLAVLSWDREVCDAPPPEAIASVLDGAARGFELVVADVPRVPGPAGEQVLRCASHIVMVVPREYRALTAAQARLDAMRGLAAPVSLVVRGPAPLDLETFDVVGALGLPLIGEFKTDSRLATLLERGDPLPERGALARLCDEVLGATCPSLRAA